MDSQSELKDLDGCKKKCEDCHLISLRCGNYNHILLSVVIINDKVNLKIELDTGSSTSVISNVLYNY